MEFALALRQLWTRRLWVLPGVVLAMVVAVIATYQVSLFPPKLEKRALQYSTASTQVYVDSHASSLGAVNADLEPLVERSNVLAHVLASPGLLALVGRYAHIPGAEIYASGPIEPNLSRFVQEPSEGKRAAEVTGETDPYRIEMDDDQITPIITIYTQAPTSKQAVALANGTARAMNTYLTSLQTASDTRISERVTMRKLGAPTAGVSDSGAGRKLGVLIFIGSVILWCGLVLLVGRFVRTWRQSAELASLRAGLASGPGEWHDREHDRRGDQAPALTDAESERLPANTDKPALPRGKRGSPDPDSEAPTR